MVFLQNVWTSLSWRTVSWSSTPGSAPTPTTPVSAASAVPGINRATTGLDDRSDAAENRFLKQWIQGVWRSHVSPTHFLHINRNSRCWVDTLTPQSKWWMVQQWQNELNKILTFFNLLNGWYSSLGQDLSLLNLLSQLEISIYKTLWLLTWPLTRGRHSGVPHSDLVVFTLDPLPDTVQPLQPRHKPY